MYASKSAVIALSQPAASLALMHATHLTCMLVNPQCRRSLPTDADLQGANTFSCSLPLIPFHSYRLHLIPFQANDDDGTKYLCSKAQLIDELEASLPGWVRRPAWYPQFVHLLKVRPGGRAMIHKLAG